VDVTFKSADGGSSFQQQIDTGFRKLQPRGTSRTVVCGICQDTLICREQM
jgi:hypothetical protein